MSEIKKDNVLDAWAENYPEVKRWLTRIQEKKLNAFDLYRFCAWSGKTPTQLLVLKSNQSSKDAEQLLDDFVADEKSGFKNSVKFRITVAVKSFYKHNYCDLARASGVIQLEKVKPYNKPSKENLRKLWSWASNLRDKALITFVNSTAIAKETLSQLKWKHIQDDWQTAELPCINCPSEILKGHGRGRYKGVQQITFLTGEAVRDLKLYKEWIEQKLGRTLTSEDNVWLETRAPYKPVAYEEFGKLIWRLSKGASVPFSLHDARRYVNTALEEIGMNPNWARKIRGRKVRGEESPYSLPAIQQLGAKFKEAVQLIEFISEKQQVPKEVLERIAALEAERQAIRSQYRLRKKVRKPPKEADDCENGEHCEKFKQVPETELLSCLQGGWQIVKELKSGEVIMHR
jgi:hypothetical protein